MAAPARVFETPSRHPAYHGKIYGLAPRIRLFQESLPMSLFRPLAGALACLALFAAVARADAPPDPLRLVSEQADFFVEVKDPHKLYEAGASTGLLKAAYALPQVRE